MAQKVNIATLELDVNDFISEAQKAKFEIDKLSEANKQLKKDGKASSREFVENEAALKGLRKTYRDNVTAANALDTAQTNLTEATKLEGKSIQEVRDERAKLTKIVNQVRGSTEKDIETRNRLNAVIDLQTEYIRENSAEYNDSKDRVGEYRQAIEDTILSNTKLGGVINQLKGYQQQLNSVYSAAAKTINVQKVSTEGLTGVQKAQAVATNAGTKAMKIFKLALASTGIGLIVVALGSLVTYLSTTQKGMDAVSRVLEPLKALFSATLGVIQDFGKVIFEAFSDPKKAVIDLWDAIKTNIVNRIEGVGDAFKALGKIISSGFTEGYEDLANATLKATTGVEDLTGKIVGAGKAVSNFLGDAVSKGSRIDALQKEIERNANNLIVLESEYEKQIKKSNMIAEDQTRSQKEREEAAKRSIELSKELLGERQKQIDKEIELKELQNSLNDTNLEDERELNELIAKRNKAETQALELQTTQQNKLNTIRQQQAAALDKETQAAIKRSQEELALYIQQQGEKARTMQEELELARDISEKKKEILKQQLESNKISEIAYQTELLAIKQDLAKKEADIAISNANKQVEIYRKSLEQRKQDNAFFSQEEYNRQVEENARLQMLEQQAALTKLENGKINQEEYNAAIDLINEENRIKNEELKAQREDAQKEKDLIDLENKRIADDENIQYNFAKQQEALEAERLAEVENAKSTGADVDLINQKYAKLEKDLREQVTANKIQLASQGLNNLSEILGKESKAGKAVAVAQTTIDTYQAATAAYKAMAGITAVGPALGALAAGAAVASGMANVKKITSTKTPTTPKAERGMLIRGRSHAQGGTLIEAEDNESIINKNSTQRFKPLLSAINQAGGGVSFGSSQATTQLQNQIINYSRLENSFKSALSEMPAPRLALDEFNDAQNNYTNITEHANI